VSYPYDGQTGVGRSFNGAQEIPTPPVPPNGWPSATPIHVYVQATNIALHRRVRPRRRRPARAPDHDTPVGDGLPGQRARSSATPLWRRRRSTVSTWPEPATTRDSPARPRRSSTSASPSRRCSVRRALFLVARIPRQVGGHHLDNAPGLRALAALRAERVDFVARRAAPFARSARGAGARPELERNTLTVPLPVRRRRRARWWHAVLWRELRSNHPRSSTSCAFP
jgi:hypothetical protein